MAVSTDRSRIPAQRTGGRSGPPDGPSSSAKRASRGRTPWWATALTVFGAVLVLASVSGVVGVKYFLGKLTSNIQTTSGALDNESGSKATTTGQLPKGAMNMLLLGLDTRDGWDKEGTLSRSDTIIVLHINAAHTQADMISIPRDTRATIPAEASMNFAGAIDKINSAYAFGSQNGRGWAGGAKLATKAVHQLTNITFNGVIVIDFAGFKGILEAMGGVYMCVDKDMWSSHYTVDSKGKVSYAPGANPVNPPGNALWFRKGCRDMQPWEALEYSRMRHSANGDYDRQRHQQQLLKAMVKKASSSGVITSPAKVSKILAAAGSSLKMDTDGVSVTNFIFGLKGVAATDIMPIKTNDGTYSEDASGQEVINDDTKALFAATAADKLDSFLLDHPGLAINTTS